MSDPKDDFAKVLAAASADFRRHLPQKIEDIVHLWADLVRDGATPEKLEELVRATHTIAGSARVFGLAEASHAARALEQYLDTFAHAPAVDDESARAQTESLINALRQSVTSK